MGRAKIVLILVLLIGRTGTMNKSDEICAPRI
jgi:hypothetical protein